MKKILKKLLKACGCIFIGLCILLVLAEISLRFILPSENIKAKTLAYLSQTTGADIKADKISASLFGIKLSNVSVDVSEGTLFNCKNLQISLNPFRLLIGHLYVKEITLHKPSLQIVRNKDGIFNFEQLAAEEEKLEENIEENTEKTGVPFDVRVENLSIHDGEISFIDLKDNIKANLKKLNFNLKKFSFYKPFNLNLSFDPYFEQEGLIFNDAHFALKADTNLNEMDLQGATLNLEKFLLEYKEASFKAQAQVNNFENPSGRISAELKNLSHNTLSDLAEVFPFYIPLVTSDISFDYFVQASKANIKSLNLKLADTELNFKANLDLNKNEISGGKINLTSTLDSFKQLSPSFEGFKPAGNISADFEFGWPLTVTGSLTLTGVEFVTDKAGTFDNINTRVDVKSIDEINIDSFTGNLNKNPFTMKANYSKKKDFADVFFDFKADKLYVFNTSPKEEKSEESTAQIAEEPSPSVSQDKTEESSFVPININAKVDIKKLDVPFIKGNNLTFKAKAKNITTRMDKTHGTFDLSIEDGQIKDIYTISNANTVTKVMFMSLGIVSKVVNTLNVLDLLNGMGKILTGDKEEEEELPVHQEINGKMDFDSFKTNIDFNQGLATMKRCSFVSSLFSFRVNGNINFDDRKIKLNVDSAPGKHTEDGIMPLNIDISGTIEDPKGSLSVLSSVGDLVTNTITNNPVSNMLKSTWSALFKSSSEEVEEEEDSDIPPSPEEN